MISMRLGGNPTETDALLARMHAAGINVQVAKQKVHALDFVNTYAEVQIGSTTDAEPAQPAEQRNPLV